MTVTIPTDVAATTGGHPHDGACATGTAAARRWVVLAARHRWCALVMLVPFALHAAQRLQVAERLLDHGPLSWPSGFYTKGLGRTGTR